MHGSIKIGHIQTGLLLRRAMKACRQEGGMPPMVEIEIPLRQGNQKL